MKNPRRLIAVALVFACESADQKEFKRFAEEAAMHDYAMRVSAGVALAALHSATAAEDAGVRQARAAFVATCTTRKAAGACEQLARDVERQPSQAMKWKTP